MLTRAVATVALTCVMFIPAAAAVASSASAHSTSVEQACEAYESSPGVGWVAQNMQGRALDTSAPYIKTNKGNFRLNCGNGVNEGAVHIEMKHNVTDWNNTRLCIAKAINRGARHPNGTKTNYSFTFGGNTVIVVTGSGKIITAYPTGADSTLPAKWAACSRA